MNSNDNAKQKRPKAYLAGFEVFRPDAAEYGKRMKALCEQYGLEGLYPLDKEIQPLPDRTDTAKAIFEGNIRLIDKADLIIANLNPFRGVEPDSGTVFECGYGYARGKKLYGYIADGREQQQKLRADIDPAAGTYKDGMTVENFGLPLNLMLAIPMEIVAGTFEDCLRKAAQDLKA
ncbi:nucleoside 2-deoxyribosyltransferase [Paenibacillus beijingensis]|uniref:Nucleoside 2-deoxyribosyltransferase n=1 Tax=Paenibacillus beijingensis TaxID=1126833 RepID=A0A0D5NJF8_9BACL|nr:nucleoside 2-deoxyribosyltransferase [Paenibacillus beijingensis]AJY75235.1 hypothetical protein VN24_12415 [Paenibacillus beijingensis]